MRVVEEDLGKRWEQGMDHHKKSKELYKEIAALDFVNGDIFCFKSGGDGDNGEWLMSLMDVYFEKQELTRGEINEMD